MVSEYIFALHVTLESKSGHGHFVCTGCDTTGQFAAHDREEALIKAGAHLAACNKFAGVRLVHGSITVDSHLHGDVTFDAKTGVARVDWPASDAPEDLSR